ncbi:MAG: ATP-dependent RecD-like DNA helicase [Chloroflexota bacterium]|nr:MAG: ATP-dependent RecD-like DNA helicase [Chloroflexota bacterium]
MDTLTGSVERITYYNPENGYSVIRLLPDQHPGADVSDGELATIVGNLPEVSPGEHLRLKGSWKNHPKHGRQFQTETCEQILPATVAGMRRYLGSGLIKGIGPRLAERIVDEFGDQALEVIENHPERLLEVPDIGPKRSRSVAQAWEEQKQVKDIMLFLHSHEVSTNLGIKIYKQYGDQSMQVVQSDPYRLAGDIHGVGFKTADRIARSLGLPHDHPSRIEAGLVYMLNEMVNEGHVFVPRALLAEETTEMLGEISPELIPAALDRLREQDRIFQDMVPEETVDSGLEGKESPGEIGEQAGQYQLPAIYLTPFYYSEMGVTGRLAELARVLPSRMSDLPPAFLPLDPQLTNEQGQAIRTAISNPVSVLTGGPGTGKTTALKALIAVVETAGKQYALASPTGRAAKRLSEATGRPASTIHRLLGFSPKEGFKFNADNPLKIDLLVVDEASMLDLILANQLLKALKPGCHLLLVGDVDQLPSVGAGDVLRDVIKSGIAPVTRLSFIFRQESGSQIITNAHRINQGQMPVFKEISQDSSNDFFLFPAESAEEAASWVEDVVTKRIPNRFGFDALAHIQVLAPMYRGAAGVNILNERLQAALNPPELKKPEKHLFGKIFRQGDKVMQTINDYDKDVFNGDIGRVLSFNPVAHTMEVEFEGRRVVYDWTEADQLVLAYSVSVHKAQGSEFPVVVVPVITAHYMMLQRNLLYTAITRARQLCVLVGNKRAIAIAVNNNRVTQRYSGLAWRLETSF